MDWIKEPWPWYVAGTAIALVFLLLTLSGRFFGMSANLRTFCALCGAGRKAEFFRFDWASQKWNLWVVAGTIMGGFIARHYLAPENDIAHISDKTIESLESYGFQSAGKAYLPDELFAVENLSDPRVLALLIMGGILVGFGARYAGGCTSGHAISGLSNLQWPSLLAVCGFFAGGLLMVYVIFPLMFPV